MVQVPVIEDEESVQPSQLQPAAESDFPDRAQPAAPEIEPTGAPEPESGSW